MAADDDRLGPARDEPRHVAADDRFAEHGAVEFVADRAVGRAPHLLEVELLDARFVGRDRGALDADAVLLDRARGFERHLVIGRVAVLDPKVVVLEVDVEIRQDELVFDEVPDDARHLVTVELDDGVADLDLVQGALLGQVSGAARFTLGGRRPPMAAGQGRRLPPGAAAVATGSFGPRTAHALFDISGAASGIGSR
jgi:hypothetical protein